MKYIPTHDIKLASILVAMGIPIRKQDPITCQVVKISGVRKEEFTFWFDVTDPEKEAEVLIVLGAYAKARDWGELVLEKEHPIYWMKGALENREVLLHWIRKNVQPMRVIKIGDKTVLIGERASPILRDKMRSLAAV